MGEFDTVIEVLGQLKKKAELKDNVDKTDSLIKDLDDGKVDNADEAKKTISLIADFIPAPYIPLFDQFKGLKETGTHAVDSVEKGSVSIRDQYDQAIEKGYAGNIDDFISDMKAGRIVNGEVVKNKEDSDSRWKNRSKEDSDLLSKITQAEREKSRNKNPSSKYDGMIYVEGRNKDGSLDITRIDNKDNIYRERVTAPTRSNNGYSLAIIGKNGKISKNNLYRILQG